MDTGPRQRFGNNLGTRGAENQAKPGNERKDKVRRINEIAK
jgi:hypothetical protein